MNDLQRAFIKGRIASYEKEIESLYYKINTAALFCSLGVGLAVTIFNIEPSPSENEVLRNFIGVVSASSVAVNATSCIKRIVARENLKRTVRDLENNLALDDLAEKPKQLIKK